MNNFHPGTFIADKLNFSNKVRQRITVGLLVYTDLFCLATALLESGFWSKVINGNLTWNGIAPFLAGNRSVLKAGPAVIPLLVSTDSNLPIPAGGLPDILITFLSGFALFLFLKVVIGMAFRMFGFVNNFNKHDCNQAA